MKKFLLAVTLLIAIPGILVNAQDGTRQNQNNQERQERQKRFMSMKIAYYSERIEFTPEEAEKFWPVYNEFSKEETSMNREHRQISRNFGSEVETMTDEQVEKLIDQHIEVQKKEAQLAADYHAKFKKILPPKKVMKLYITEVEFREYILRQLRGNRDEPGGGRREEHP